MKGALVFSVELCRSLFVILSCFFWQLYCLPFFDLQLLITALVSSNFSCLNYVIHIFQLHVCNNLNYSYDKKLLLAGCFNSKKSYFWTWSTLLTISSPLILPSTKSFSVTWVVVNFSIYKIQHVLNIYHLIIRWKHILQKNI